MPKSHRVEEVFTPTSQATLNFVPRKGLDDTLVNALRTPGKQIIVYGESGSGKTTLLRKHIHDEYPSWISTSCHGGTLFSDLLLDAFDQLDVFFSDTREASSTRSISTSLEAQFAQARTAVQSVVTEGAKTGQKRVVPPQLTPQRLARWMGEKDLCWVIEDFHKVALEEKVPLAQTFKIFSDAAADYPRVKIVAIGATDTARDVVAYDNEMRNRVAEINVPLMSPAELRQILNGSDRLLNVSFAPIADDVVSFSSGLASVTHHLALNACRAADIHTTQAIRKQLVDEDLARSLETYIAESSDTLRSRFEKAIRRERERKFHNTELILRALAGGPQDGLTHAQIVASIRKTHADYPPSNATIYLEKLQQDGRGALIRRSGAGLFRFVDPVIHSYARAQLKPPEGPKIATWSAYLERTLDRAMTEQFVVFFGSAQKG